MGLEMFLFSTAFGAFLGPTQPPFQCVPEVKRPERETDHSPTSSVEVKNPWSYTSTPQYVFLALYLIKWYIVMEWDLVKYRDNFVLAYFLMNDVSTDPYSHEAEDMG